MESSQPENTKEKSTQQEEEEEDFNLSDVPMDEQEEQHEQTQHESDEESESEAFDKVINDEQEYISKLIFKNINRKKINLQEEEEPEEPEEELDEEERLKLLMDHLDPVQMSRYEYFKRSTVNKGGVKKIANTVLNQSVSQTVAIVLSGVSKLFLGEIIEKARDIKLRYDKANYLIKLKEKRELNAELKKTIALLKREEAKDDEIINITPYKTKIDEIKKELNKIDLRKVSEKGPLLPEHIREAWRLYQVENENVPGHQWRHQGERDGMMFR